MNSISDYIVAFLLLFSLIIVIVGFIARIIPWETPSAYRSRIDSEDNNEEAYNRASKHSEYWYATK